MAYQLQSVQQAFGRAPDLGETANLLLLVWVDPEPSAVAEARGLGDSVLVARAPADLPVALDQAVMREAYGLWNGAGVRAAVPRLVPDADPRAALLAGMNDYMAWRALLESGRIGRISYWDGVRALARGMGTQATGDIVAAASAVPSDASQPDPLRARGHLYGLLLDQRLRQDTGDSLTLAEAIRRLHEARNYYTTGQLTAWADWIEHLRQLTGLDYGPLYDGLVRFGDRAPLAEVPQLAGPLISETRTVTAPDGQPLVYQWLDGPSARAGIYLSDGPGGTPYDWLMIEGEALAPYLDMAYLDQRGAGRSALAPGAPLSLDALVDDIEVVRRDLGAERLVLVGHSWGGFLALWYAARYPERLDALVLVAPITSYQQIAETIGGQTTQRAVEPRLSAVADGVDSYEEWTASLAAAKELGLYGSDLRAAQAASEQAYQRLVAGALLPPWVALENPQLLPVLVGRDDLLHADPLPAIAADGERSYDVLWICGRRDGLVPAESLEQAQRLVGGQVVTLAESGHEVFIDIPAAVLNVLITFLLQQ
jgi:pimeloyl-ACP methyl ester carboxylesterase